MTRIVLGGADLADLQVGEFTDEYVKLLFFRNGPEARPDLRSLTVRAWDPAAVELTVDVVDHGPEGLISPWRQRPGPVTRCCCGDPVAGTRRGPMSTGTC
jgi:NADPH-dependent ferric siderophore reductase